VLRVADGTCSELRYLGADADESATIYLDGAAVMIRQAAPRDYDGFDLQVTAALTSTLQFEIAPDEHPEETRRINVPLADLVSGYYHSELDAQGNQLLIQRTAADVLRVAFDRPSLVFAPGEVFEFQLQPHQLGIEDGALLRFHLQLTPARAEQTLWEQQVESTLTTAGLTPALEPIRVTLPSDEGVYDVVVSVYRKKTIRNTFVRARPVHQRRVQLIVIAPQAPAVVPRDWELVDTIDPKSARWMEWLARVPKLPLLPDFRQEPLRNIKVGTRRHLNRDLVELTLGGWQAYPLPVAAIGQPHVLDVEYPSDVEQSLGISIIEPNAVGKVVPLGLDSGVHIAPGVAADQPRLMHHKLVFWPRTATPLVLLVNRHERLPAVFGQIQIQAGPLTLPPVTPAEADAAPSRLLAAYFDRPLFAENFSATEAADESGSRSLRDWLTFYEGGKRLVEYLKFVGYNGAVLCVARQGSSIYPSTILQPTPKYDTGAYFATGQDPRPKDVLEMLFRLFERDGLQLVPAVQFSSTLDELEQQLRSDPAQATGIRLTDAQGRAWRELQSADHGSAPHYNPLDPRVQAAMRRVLTELADRYAHHRSFSGLAVQLDPDSYAVLPGEPWGQDAQTRQRFEQAQDAAVADRTADATDSRGPDGRVRDPQRAWLTWRAGQLAQLHQDLLADLKQRRSDAQLWLLGGNLCTSPAVQMLIRPTLPNEPNLRAALLQLGLDLDRYADSSGIVFCRPDRTGSPTPLSPQAVNINLATSPVVDGEFARVQPAASLLFHESHPLALPSFDAVSPFGQDNTRTVLYTHSVPSGAANRQQFVHHLALRDTHYLLNGGWMLGMGQEDAVRPLLATLRRLPARQFTTVTPQTSGLPSQPLVVRTLAHEASTYLYVVNDSPWAVTAEVDLRAARSCELTRLGAETSEPLRWSGSEATWNINLEPYDVLAAVAGCDDVQVDTWRVTMDRADYAQLRQQVNELSTRATLLSRAERLPVLENPSFEQAPDRLPGWIHVQGNGVTIAPDAGEHCEGAQSLKMASQGPVAWIRSTPFNPPKTGRIAVMVRLKIEDPQQQPPLRLAIEGRRLDGTTYYKPFNVVQNPRAQPLTSDWSPKPFVMLVPDLPTSELADLRVGFDLMGAGTVWIDDVQVYDRWFPKNERDDLMIMSGLAARSLSMGQLGDCQRILSGFWPQFLREHVELSEARVAALPAEAPRDARAFPPPQPAPAPDGSAAPQDKDKASMLDKVRQHLPAKVVPFRLR
jgi:hypothetical protein